MISLDACVSQPPNLPSAIRRESEYKFPRSKPVFLRAPDGDIRTSKGAAEADAVKSVSAHYFFNIFRTVKLLTTKSFVGTYRIASLRRMTAANSPEQRCERQYCVNLYPHTTK